MQYKRIRSSFALIAAAVVCKFAFAGYVVTRVDYRDPATNALAVSTQLWGINNKGQVIGVASLDGVSTVNFIYEPSSGTFTTIPQPPGFDGVNQVADVISINDAGVVAGSTWEPNGQRGFTWSAGAYSFFQYPGSLDTVPRWMGNPTDAHPQGLVTGYADTTTGLVLNGTFGIIYDPFTGSSATLPTPGSYTTFAQGINRAGQIVGSVRYLGGSGAPLANGNWGFLFTPGNGADPMTGGTLNYFRINGMPTRARGINDNGVLAGFATGTGGISRSYVGTSAGFQEIVMPETVGSNCAEGSVPEGLSNAGQVTGFYADAQCNLHGYSAVPASLPTGTTAGGAYMFNVDVVPNTPIFIDPPVAMGYQYNIGRGDPRFASVSLPLGIGDNKFRLVVDGHSYRVNAGQVFDFTQHGYASGVDSFEVRCVDPAAMLDPVNAQAFPTELTFATSGRFTGTQRPFARQIPNAAFAAQMRQHEQCLADEDDGS